jgi:hypothetical protein
VSIEIETILKEGRRMISAKRMTLSILGGLLAAGLLGSGTVSADESDRGEVMKAADDTTSPLYVPVDEGKHSWTYVKTVYMSSGYIKLYSDRDSYWYYTKEAYYDSSGKSIRIVYDKFAI